MKTENVILGRCWAIRESEADASSDSPISLASFPDTVADGGVEAGPYSGGHHPFVLRPGAGGIERRRFRSAHTGARWWCVMFRRVRVRTTVSPIAAVFTALILGLSCPTFALAQTAAVSAAYLIVPGQGIGAVRLGMTLEQVRAALGHEERTVPDPVTRATVVAWKTSGGGRFSVWFRDGRAVNIAVNRDGSTAILSEYFDVLPRRHLSM